MKKEINVSLKQYNTFGLDSKADQLIKIYSEEEAITLLKEDQPWKNNLFVIGGGSNLLFLNDFKGTLLHPAIEGIDIIEESGDFVIISAGAGVVWDDLVAWSVERQLEGLENLSLIPGNVGASPVQNIGAYGVEVKDLIEKVETVSVESGSLRSFSPAECSFGYRYSIFKGEQKGKYLVTRVHFRLSKNHSYCLDYGSLKEEVLKSGRISLENIRKAVISLRRNKLPDHEVLGNAGSFFKNPVVPEDTANNLLSENPGMPVYNEQTGYKKLAAGWLIERCGWRGKRSGNAGTYEKQALIIVNHGGASGKQLFEFSEEIRRSVVERFGIELEREVEVL